MNFKFGLGSMARMVGLHPDLQRVLKRAIELTDTDFFIVEGVRSIEQCYINFGKGRNAAECVKAGCPAKYAQPTLAKVTWLNHPLSSNHAEKGDGYGHAVDIWPYPAALVLNQKPAQYEPLFDKIAYAMFTAAKQLNVSIRWGADWDMDNKPRERGETDNPHFELKGK